MKALLSALAVFGLVSGQTPPSGIKTNRAEIFEPPFRDVVCETLKLSISGRGTVLVVVDSMQSPHPGGHPELFPIA